MAIQLVNIGTANKGNGDPIRVAFDKINKNFGEHNSSITYLTNTSNDLNDNYDSLSNTVSEITNELNDLSDVVASIPNEATLTFDFGSIVPKQVFTPIELLFYTSQIDMGSIVSPTPVLYDAGTLG
jgi:uncharacterized membrane protein YdfJ with MMPL/SSD domain